MERSESAQKEGIQDRLASSEELSVHLTSIRTLDSLKIEEVTQLINVANRAQPRIFSGDRLDPSTLVEKYLDFGALLMSTTELMGCILFQHREADLFLSLLAIRPDYQGQGLGSLLVRRAVDFAGHLGLREVRLDAVNGPLVVFYEKLGFAVERQDSFPVGHWGANVEFEVAKMVLRI